MVDVVLDACVLHPAYLRDTLLSVADAGLLRPRWTEDILDELTRSLTGRGYPPTTVGRLVTTMSRAFPDADVSGHRPLIPAMTCDPGDRHVLAAAVRCGAGAVVTLNVSDFPTSSADPFDIRVLHPDGLLLELLAAAPATVLAALEVQQERYRTAPRTRHEVLDALARSGVPRFAAAVRARLD